MKRVIVSLLFMYAISCNAILEVKAILAFELAGADPGTPTTIGQSAYEVFYPGI